MIHTEQVSRIAPKMNQGFALSRLEQKADTPERVEHAHGEQQVSARQVALVDGSAPNLIPPLTRLPEQAPHLRMNEPHLDRHFEAIRETRQSVGLTDGKDVTRRVLEP